MSKKFLTYLLFWIKLCSQKKKNYLASKINIEIKGQISNQRNWNRWLRRYHETSIYHLTLIWEGLLWKIISADVLSYGKRERHSKKHLQKLLSLKKDTVSSRALYLQKYSGLREIGTYPRALEQETQLSSNLMNVVLFLLHWPPGSSDLNSIEHVRINLGI